MDDKVNGARVAWATIKLTGAGQRRANLEEPAARTGLAAAEAKRLLRLVWREKAGVRDGLVNYDDQKPDEPRRYRTEAGGRPLGSGKGCSLDVYLLALALGQPVHGARRSRSWRRWSWVRATSPSTASRLG